MPFYACMMGGMCETLGPLDICKMMYGPVPGPTPCEDLGEWTLAVGDPTVLMTGMPACSLISIIEMSEADEEGYLGGLVSETIIEEIEAEMGCEVVLIVGIPAASLGVSMTVQNLMNAVGLYSVPSQTVVTGS